MNSYPKQERVKPALLVGLIVLVVILFYVVWMNWRLSAQNNEIMKYMANQYNKDSNIEKQYRDSTTGRQYTESRVISVDRENMPLVMRKQVAAELTARGITLDNIRNIVTTGGRTSAKVRAPIVDTLIVMPDSTVFEGRAFYFQDSLKWFRVSGMVSKEDILILPSFRDSLQIIQSYEKGPKRFALDLFPPKQLRSLTINHNPYSETKYIETIYVKPKFKFLGIFRVRSREP